MKYLSFFTALLAAQIFLAPHGLCVSPTPVKQSKPSGSAVVAVRDKWAILIGVGRYDDAQVGTVKNAGSNVLKVARVLVDPDVGRFPANHVLVVTQEKANKASLTQAVCEDWLYKKALPGDLIVLYICMRGCPNESLDDWLLLGADASYVNRAEKASSLTALLTDLRKRTQAKNIVCLLDSQLVSAVSDKYPQGLNAVLKKIASASQTTILTADANMLKSRDSQTQASSQFVEYLVEGLKAGGGQLTLDTIAGYITESMNKSGAPSQAQKPALLVSATSPEVAKLAIGTPIKNTSSALANVRIGYSIERLEATNPELAKDARRMAAPDGNSPGNKIEALLKKEEQESDDDDQLDGPPVDFKPYMDAMKKAIQSKWDSPSGLDQKKVVTNFSIQRDGRITEAEIVESSGNSTVDKSALQALKDASPLPPLPKGAPKRVQIHYKFDYKVN